MHRPVLRAGQAGGGEESLEGGEAGEGVWLQAEDVDLAGDLAPDQLTGGVVPQVQLRGQDEEVHWQPRPGVVVLWGGIVHCDFKYTFAQQILKHKLVLGTGFSSLRFPP